MQEYFREAFKDDPIGYSIFDNWINFQKQYLSQISPEETQNLSEKFWLNKIIRYFFPFDFLLSSPFQVPGMKDAVQIMHTAFTKKETTNIVIYGDRDADGVCSSSLLYLFLRDTVLYPEHNLKVMVPREEDKYGIVDDVVQRIIDGTPDVLLTLDCGSMNRDGLNEIRRATGCEVIVLDHHYIPELEQDYPPGAFVNPKRLPFPDSVRDHCTSSLVWQFTRAFTYAFTPEMDKLHRVVGESGSFDYINGVQVDGHENEVPGRTYAFTSGGNGQVDCRARWDHLVRKDLPFARFDNFLNRLPTDLKAMFHEGDRYLVLKHFGMQKVFSRVKNLQPLAALGLVADLMPLWDDNRILLAEGLRLMRAADSELPIGVRELLRKLDVSLPSLSEQDVGFSICPVINAAGRLGKSEEALLALIEKDPLDAATRAFKLKKLNKERKELTKTSIRIIQEKGLLPNGSEKVAIIYDEGIHRGISGLLASRVAEESQRPAIVLVNDGDALRGSIRACKNENVFDFLCDLSDFFVQFGGHRQAAGFTLRSEKLDEFKREALLKAEIHFSENSEADSNEDLTAVIEVGDIELRSRLWDRFLRFAPYGVMNPHPTLKINLSKEVKFVSMGKTREHARLSFSGVPESNVEGVWFFHRHELDSVSARNPVTVWAEPHLNRFAGKLRYQLRVKKVDIADQAVTEN